MNIGPVQLQRVTTMSHFTVITGDSIFSPLIGQTSEIDM